VNSDNHWAEPDGFASNPPAIRYRIRGPAGGVLERETERAFDSGRQRYFHSLHLEDQPFADAIVDLVQQACAYFHVGDGYQPLPGVSGVVVSDDEVRARIERLDRGENTREAERSGLGRYPLTDLPFGQQRALVEQIEALKREWQFEILGAMDAAA